YPNCGVFTDGLYGRYCRAVFPAIWLDSGLIHICIVNGRTPNHPDDGRLYIAPRKKACRKTKRADGLVFKSGLMDAASSLDYDGSDVNIICGVVGFGEITSDVLYP